MTDVITATDPIDFYSQTIDSREIIERLEELEELSEQFGSDLPEELREELDTLRAVNEDGQGFSDWEYGEVLIHFDHFTDYIREMVEDCYDVPQGWPFCHIDWDAAAQAASVDYSEILLGNQTFLIR